jgi:hypothetical protein
MTVLRSQTTFDTQLCWTISFPQHTLTAVGRSTHIQDSAHTATHIITSYVFALHLALRQMKGHSVVERDLSIGTFMGSIHPSGKLRADRRKKEEDVLEERALPDSYRCL